MSCNIFRIFLFPTLRTILLNTYTIILIRLLTQLLLIISFFKVWFPLPLPREWIDGRTDEEEQGIHLPNDIYQWRKLLCLHGNA